MKRKISSVILRFFFFIILPIIFYGCYSDFQRQDILLYNGAGTDPSCVDVLINHVDKERYNVIKVNADYILNTKDWERHTKLVVMPGWADCSYHEAGIAGRIKLFVQNGGAYLGFCAGAYFAGNKVEFALGTDLEVSENRDLAFFNGTTSGPILKPYVYGNKEGACAASIKFNNKTYKCYYNGGCTFVNDKTPQNTTVLATYQDKDNLPAIIECKVDKGLAILSGVHMEFNLDNLQEKELKAELKASQKKLEELSNFIMNRLLKSLYTD